MSDDAETISELHSLGKARRMRGAAKPRVSTAAEISPPEALMAPAGTSPGVTDPIVPPADPVAPPATKTSTLDSPLIILVARLLGGNQANKFTGIGVALAALATLLASAYAAWFMVLPRLWVWGDTSLTKTILAGFASLFLFAVPLYVYMMMAAMAEPFADVKVSQVKETRFDLQAIEAETIERLGGTQVGELLTLVRYSRAQLDAYYAMGLQQTRGSFKNALIAMWLGFSILLLGIFSYVVPVEIAWLRPPSGDFTVVVLASAVIVELIAALFLWTYRSTVGQLTFYYQLQMRSHAAIQSFSIASTMVSNDDAKRAVIDSALATSLTPERLDLPSSKGFAALIGRG